MIGKKYIWWKLWIAVWCAVLLFLLARRYLLPTQDEKIGAHVDDQILDGSFLDLDAEQELENQVVEKEAMFTGSVPIIQDLSANSFKDIYYQAKLSNDKTRQYLVLQKVYNDTNTQELLPYLVNMAVELRKYEDAIWYVGVLENAWLLHEKIDPQVLFLLLFNGLELNFKDISRIKDLVLQYEKKWLVGSAEVALWSSLITFVRWDLENYSYFMGALSWSAYNQMFEEYQKNVSITQSFSDVPETYLDGLTALQVFSHWWYQVSRVAANRIMQADEKYILPRQLYGYSSLLLWDWKEVLPAMNWLIEKDADNEQLYSFLAGIAHMQLEQYPEAILLLRDVRDEQFRVDALRYLLLAYVRIGEFEPLANVLETFLQQTQRLPHDFFTLFDLFFYEPLREDKPSEMYSNFPDQANRLIDTCYSYVSTEYAYICLWWKAWLLLTKWEERKAYQYLKRLVRWYPKTFIFETLWDISFNMGEIDEAKDWFIKSISATQDESLRQEIMHKIRSTILSNSN